jgi:AcrR family transcriptional regulator
MDTKAQRGRPRQFDPETALDQVLDVFWRQGYEGTSMADLTQATGVNKPSLYALYGNKEALFRLAVDRYIDGPMAFVKAALEEPSARKGVEALLRGFASSVSGANNPQGCLTVQGALACGPESEPICQELTRRRLMSQSALIERLRRARAEGELPESASPDELGRYFDTVAQGLAVQGKAGATERDLQRIVDLALRAWPERAH